MATMQHAACIETQVVVGVQDPNPLVAGAGMQTLRDAGIAVAGPCEVIASSAHTCLFLCQAYTSEVNRFPGIRVELS